MLKNRPDTRVLACAPSNSAADLILERVAEHNVIPKSEMIRLNAFGRSVDSVNKNVLVCLIFSFIITVLLLQKEDMGLDKT